MTTKKEEMSIRQNVTKRQRKLKRIVFKEMAYTCVEKKDRKRYVEAKLVYFKEKDYDDFIHTYGQCEMDVRLTEELRSLDVSEVNSKYDKTQKKGLIKLIMDICRVFDEQYKREIFIKMKDAEKLSDIEHSKMSCLTLSVALNSKITNVNSSQSVLRYLIRYLRDLSKYAPFSRTVLTAIQIFLYAMCNISRSNKVHFQESFVSILMTFFKIDTNERINLLSAYLIVFLCNRRKMPLIDLEELRGIVLYVNEVFEKMNADKTDKYIGFVRGEREIDEIQQAMTRFKIEPRKSIPRICKRND